MGRTSTQKYPYIISSTPEGEYRVRTKAGNDYGPFKSLPLAVKGMELVINPEVHYYDEAGKEIVEVLDADH